MANKNPIPKGHSKPSKLPALKTPLGTEEVINKPAGFNYLTPATEFRIIETARMICEGKSRKTCLEEIQKAQGCGVVQAKAYYNAALSFLIPDDMDSYQKGLIQANIERLETIIQEGIDNRNDAKRGADYLRTAKEAITELNKMLGLGGNKVSIATSKDGEQTVEISFN